MKRATRELVELRRDALLRKLISIEELTDAWGEIVRSVRQLAVSIPARCQEAMPHLRFEDFETFRKIVREVLTEPRRSRPTTRQSLQAAKRTISRQSSNANEGVRQDPARSSVADFETERKGEQFLLKPSYRYADARRLKSSGPLAFRSSRDGYVRRQSNSAGIVRSRAWIAIFHQFAVSSFLSLMSMHQ